MKNFIKVITVLAIATVFASFTFLPGSPSDVAVNFEKVMLVWNLDSAKQYVASNSFDLFNQMGESFKNNLLPDSSKQLFSQAVVKSTGETQVNDSTANVAISVILPKPIDGLQETTDTLVLKKENDTWKVDLMATMQKAMESRGIPMGDTVPYDSAIQVEPDTLAVPAAPSEK